jgi:hypothetical protein
MIKSKTLFRSFGKFSPFYDWKELKRFSDLKDRLHFDIRLIMAIITSLLSTFFSKSIFEEDFESENGSKPDKSS